MTELLKLAIASGQVSADEIKAHRAAGELPITMYEPRFQHTYCSQCGRDCGPGDEGFSSCRSHELRGLSSAIAQPVPAAQPGQGLTNKSVSDAELEKALSDHVDALVNRYPSAMRYVLEQFLVSRAAQQ